MNDTSELKTNGLYYERFKQRLVYVDDVRDDVVLASDYHSDDRIEYDRGELEGKIDVGDFSPVDDVDEEEDLDTVQKLKRYQELAKRLDSYDRVVAKVEKGKTFSPNIHVRARKGYGAPSNVMSIILGEFNADEVLAAEPVNLDGDDVDDVAIMYRAKFGGR